MNSFLKHNFLRKHVAAIIALFILFFAVNSPASSENTMPDTTNYLLNNFHIQNDFAVDSSFQGLVGNENRMRAGLLFDATTNEIVWQKDMHYTYPIASLTKMMVALLVVEDINNCKADWNDEITFTKQYLKKVKRRKVTYSVNETYTIDALFHLAMIASNNEACMVLAKHFSGSVEDFVARMNNRARELNMNNTFYSNPSGLPAAKKIFDNNSSPHDLLLLSLEMLKYPEITSVTRKGYADIANDKSSGIYRNHNHLVIDYENEVDGLKTGYTKNARFCLAASSYKASHRLISIVLGVTSPYERNQIVADMLSNYYQKIGIGRLANNVAIPQDVENEMDTLNAAAGVSFKPVWTREKKYYVVKRGETLSGIADRYNCSLNTVKKWNGLRSSRVNKGQRLLVYVNVKKWIPVSEDQIQKDGNEEENINPEPAKQDNVIKLRTNIRTLKIKKENANNSAKNYVYHTVQPGDTLWNIAQKYKGVTVDEIKKTNNISNGKSLKAGTKLKIILNG